MYKNIPSCSIFIINSVINILIRRRRWEHAFNRSISELMQLYFMLLNNVFIVGFFTVCAVYAKSLQMEFFCKPVQTLY